MTTPERIDDEQQITHATIAGKCFPRVRYGDGRSEQGSFLKARCPWCGVAFGQYHIAACPVEPCPVCQELSSFCDCAAAEGLVH